MGSHCRDQSEMWSCQPISAVAAVACCRFRVEVDKNATKELDTRQAAKEFQP